MAIKVDFAQKSLSLAGWLDPIGDKAASDGRSGPGHSEARCRRIRSAIVSREVTSQAWTRSLLSVKDHVFFGDADM